MDHEIAVKSKAAERYLLGELAPEERDEFEAHFFECAACGEEVRSASEFLEGLRQALADRTAPKAVRGAAAQQAKAGGGWWTWLGALRPAFGYAAIALLLVIAGESVWIVRTQRELAGASAPRLLAPAVLRPQTRGEPSRVYAPKGAPLLLTFDVLSGQSYPRYLVRIDSASGEKVLEFDGAAPPPEKPVSLSIPGGRLTPGRYTMTLSGLPAAGQAPAPLGQYHFEVIDQEEPAR